MGSSDLTVLVVDDDFRVANMHAGIVDALGPGVDQFQLGDRVLAMPHLGAFAELVVTDVGRTFAMPAMMSFTDAAAFPIVYQTSWCALVTRTTVVSGETLLVHAGASGVGMSAIQIGKALGAKVMATAGSQQKLEFSFG